MARLQRYRRLQSTTGIEAGTRSPRQAYPRAKSGGHLERAMTPEEFASIRGPLRLAPGQVRESHSSAERRVPRITGEQGTGLRIEIRQNERRRSPARCSEHPFGVGGN